MSLLRMISNNIGQIAYLTAQRYNLKRIYFGGYFIRNTPATMCKISFAIHYWSRGEMQALFLHHEGFLGAMGALISADSQVTYYEKSKMWLSQNWREMMRSSQNFWNFNFDVKICHCNNEFCQGLVCRMNPHRSPSKDLVM